MTFPKLKLSMMGHAENLEEVSVIKEQNETQLSKSLALVGIDSDDGVFTHKSKPIKDKLVARAGKKFTIQTIWKRTRAEQ